MKKTLWFFQIAFFLCGFLSAELYKPNRYIEMGVDVSGGFSNNYFSIADIFTSTITIDLQDIAKNIADDGLIFDALASSRACLAFNIHEKFRLSFFAGIAGSGYLDIQKELFDFLGKGYQAGDSAEFEVVGYGDIFADMGIQFHTKLFDTYGITITPSYVVPIAYVDDAKATATFTTTKNGAIKAEANAAVSIYTVVDAQKYVENTFSSQDITDSISDIMSQGGFDLSFEIERQLLKRLDVGLFTRIPIVPGRLTYMMTDTMSAYFYEENLLGELLDAKKKSTKRFRKNSGEFVYEETDTKYVFRPFRLGAEAAWRPFGNWCVFRPKLALVVRHPYSSQAIFYPEYALDAQFSVFNIIGISAGTAYENRIFVQRFGCMLNARVVQIDVQAQLRSASFINSFRWAGAGMYVGVRIGF